MRTPRVGIRIRKGVDHNVSHGLVHRSGTRAWLAEGRRLAHGQADAKLKAVEPGGRRAHVKGVHLGRVVPFVRRPDFDKHQRLWW